MTRRDIGLLVTLALLSLPFAAVAQPPGSMHRIGVLRLAAPPASSERKKNLSAPVLRPNRTDASELS